MLQLFIRIFVQRFYKKNVGFFLFFFFFFFGVVAPGTLVTYHLSLITSLLSSPVVLSFVMGFWALYYLKCVMFCMKFINDETGMFLYKFPLTTPKQQILLLLLIQTLLFAPVLIYIMVVVWMAAGRGFKWSLVSILCFQLFIYTMCTYLLFHRLNTGLKEKQWFRMDIFRTFKKPFVYFLILYFLNERKLLFMGLKFFSLVLLYIILVVNRHGLDNDAFLLFYIVILLCHVTIPPLSINFLENQLLFSRNLPLNFFSRMGVYLAGYAFILLPELAYFIVFGRPFLSVTDIMRYYLFGIVTLLLLTAVYMGKETGGKEYIKFVFILFFVSIFALHTGALWEWVLIELTIGMMLFYDGYYQYENNH